jgi:putative ABC transport system permease protein
MKAVFYKAIKDLRRRRVQAAVVFVTALLAVGTGTMALTLIAQTRDPYRTAFEAQKGSHLQVVFDGQVADPSAIAGTPAMVGASASGGPYRSTPLQFRLNGHKYSMTTIGRDAPGGEVQQLRITAGHWPANDGEIALTRSFADVNHISLGDKLKVISVSQEPLLTVTAEVADVDEGSADVSNQNSWVLSSAISGLASAGPPSYLMDYRFASDPTDTQLQADVSEIRGALPPGSITSSTNYIAIRTVFNITNQITTGLLLAFSVVALLATVAIVASLVTGIVISAYREIGIMKALGFTPLQVDLVFVLQILIPVAAGSLIGVAIGTAAAQPLVASSWQALQLAYQPAYSAGIDAVVLGGTLLVVTAAAFVPAFRAGRLRAAEVIARASAPRGKSGRWLRGLGARLRLPRAVVLGSGDAFARPTRAIMTAMTIFIAAATVTLALGVPRSFSTIISASTSGLNTDVVVHRTAAISDADATSAINSAGRPARVVGELDQSVAVPGIGDPVLARMFRGDPAQLGFLLYSGRWYSAPGEAVAPRALMQDAHLRLGDHFTVTVAGKPLSLVLVGDALDATGGGHSLLMDFATVQAIVPDAAPDTYLIVLQPGSSIDAYIGRVAGAQPDLLDVSKASVDAITITQTVSNVLLALAALMIVIAIAGIFNTLLLNSRERVRDTATLKAIGMSPRQVMLMVAASAAPLAIIAGALAIPAGIGLDRALFVILGTAAGGNDIPAAVYEVLPLWELLAVPVAAVAVAVAAALIPGSWAARTNVVTALHAE